MNAMPMRTGLLCLVIPMLLAACAPASQPSAQAPLSDQAPQSEAARPAAAPSAPARAGAPAPAAQQSSAAQQPPVGEQRLIVKTANLTLLVPDVAQTSSKAQGLAETLGGFVVTATQREEGGRPAATVQMRVPAQRFDEAMAQLKGMAERVQNEQVSSKDVTEEFVDTDARLRNLRATEQRYLDLLARASSVEDILKIEQQLSSVRGQIEQLQGRLNFLQRSAELSTITVELRLPAAAQAPPPSDWAIQPIFRNAVSALLATLQWLLGLVIFGVVFAPLWVPAVLVVRWLRRRRRARRAAVAPAPAAPATP